MKLKVYTQLASNPHHSAYHNRPELRFRHIAGALAVQFHVGSTSSDDGQHVIRTDSIADEIEIVDRMATIDYVVDSGVHRRDLLQFMRDAHASWKSDGHSDDDYVYQKSGGLIPYHFAPFERERTSTSSCTSPHEPSIPLSISKLPIWKRVGYYCKDMMTPIFADSFLIALKGTGVVQEMVNQMTNIVNSRNDGDGDGDICMYGLTTLPGHHSNYAEYGFINNAAVAASQMAKNFGRVATLDIDYHHGDGTQCIFYNRSDVLTVSIHAEPAADYPSYTGFAHEIGGGDGMGYNINYPLPQNTDIVGYSDALRSACVRIAEFMPSTLVISLGVDTYELDPDPSITNGKFSILIHDFYTIGSIIREHVRFAPICGHSERRIVVIQEGGYNLDAVAPCVMEFLKGLCDK